MFRHYFKTAVRIFWKQRTFSLINIVGLALSMAVCLLLIMLIKDANQFDLFHKSPERIYRINTEAVRKGGGTETYASSPYTMLRALTKGYAGIETSVMLSRFNGDVAYQERKFSFDGKFTDGAFFSVFGFALQAGQTYTALTEPFSIVLTDKLSEKLFPAENPVGKVVDVAGTGLFKVTGVLAKFPGKTHLEFDALMSFSTMPVLEKKDVVSSTTDNWLNYYTNYNYIQLNNGTDPEQVEMFLEEIASANYRDLPLETRDAGYHFKLQPLQKITPGPLLSNNMGRGIPSVVLWFITVLALVIIVSAAFNYTNLTIAKAVGRTREIALRKVVGSSRWYIFLQVLSESVITSLISLLVACVILQFLIPSFTGLSVMNSFDITFKTDPLLIFYFVLFAVITGLFAGMLPATVLSRIKPLMLLQRLQHLPYFRRLGLRKVLLVIQFLVSLIFINMVYISYKQIQHGMDINFGSRHAHIFNINLQGQNYAKAAQEFAKVPGVGKISATSTLMGNYSDQAGEYRTSKDKDPVIVREYFTDENYISNFDLKLIAGKNFPASSSQQHEQFAIVNEEFVEHFQMGSAIDAVGKTVLVNDSTELVVIGVLKNFLFKPQEYALAPMVMRYNPAQWNYLNISIHSSAITSTTAQLGAVWKSLDPYHQFKGRFYEDEIQTVYAGMRDVTGMVAFVGFLGMMIACLGLLGITMFTVQTKTREISIRKVVGAGPFALIKLLSRSYLQVTLISVLIAVPVIAVLGNMALQGISQRIGLGPGLFVPGITVMLFFSALTVGSQTIRAAFINPVEGLKER